MYETLMCQSCYRDWDRVVVRGRKPRVCPNCRPRTIRPLVPANTILNPNPKSLVIYTDGGMSEAGYREKSDCTVRALATATGSSYQEAHAFMAANGRRNGRGHAFSAVLSRNRHKVLGHNTIPANIFNRARGLRTALLRNPQLRKGTWIIQMPRHVVTLRNGVLLDSFDSSAKDFRNAWLVTPL